MFTVQVYFNINNGKFKHMQFKYPINLFHFSMFPSRLHLLINIIFKVIIVAKIHRGRNNYLGSTL